MKESSADRKVTLKQLVGACFFFVLLSVVGGALLAATAIPIAAVSGTTTNTLTGLFEDLPTDIDFTKPSQQSTIVAADGSPIATFYAENRIVVGSDQISQYLKDAAVSIEDERFYDHNGVDAQGIMGAFVNNLTGGNLAGGSTITQQYVKNALIEEGRIAGDDEMIADATRTTLARKLNEARYAIAIENHQTKDEILTAYLNVAQFGPSQWGVETAARHYFGVSAKDVTIAQAATLAGVTQAPNMWDPESNPEGAQDRRDLVLAKMLELGKISQEEHDEAVATNVVDTLHITDTPNGCAGAGNAAYFCESVVQQVMSSDALGKTNSDKANALYRGGLTIVSTMIPTNQQAAVNAIDAHISINDESGAQMALASIEPGTGKVVAMAQNTHYGDPTEEDPTRTKLNLSVGEDQGGGVGFQSGSTFKMFTLVSWLAAEKSTYDRVNGTKHLIPASEWTNSCFPDQVSDYEPANSGNVNYGMINVRKATSSSVNSAYADMASQVDLCDIWKTANAMGVRRGEITTKKDLQESYVQQSGVKEGEPLPLLSMPSMVLGTNSVTPLSTANAYATLAADGKMCEPIMFTEIKERDGEVLYTQESTCNQAIDEDVARLATTVLEGVSAAALPGRPAAGKTGTTDNSANVWFAGYTPQLATAVWLGHEKGELSLDNTTFKGVYYYSTFGSSIPAPVYREYMTNALEGQEVMYFQRSGLTDRPSPIPVPDVRGLHYNDAASRIRAAGFDVVATATADGPQDETVYSMSPSGGSKASPGSTVTLVVSMPPEEPKEEEKPKEQKKSEKKSENQEH